jgi:membrane protease YdiL (CAAX protease family)/uncharacterized OB-fold protein
MSEEERDDRFIRYCNHCGAKVQPGEVYCSNCGKLIIKEPKLGGNDKRQSEKRPTKERKREISARKCSNCGSIIRSTVLKECPICNTELEESPPSKEYAGQERPGFIFTEDRLEPEEQHTLHRDNWNLKEGTSVFTSSILIYITTMLFISLFLMPDQSIFGILISQIPEILIGVYPLWYIYSNKHSYKKFGFNFSKKPLIIAGVIGFGGGIGLIFYDFFSEFLINLMLNLGLENIIDINPLLINSLIIKNADIVWILILLVLVALTSISTEILFRGTLHNALRQRFGDDIKGKAMIIGLVALAYSAIYGILSFPLGLILFPSYFLLSILLGIIYEAGKRNLASSIIASVIYYISSLLIILLIF